MRDDVRARVGAVGLAAQALAQRVEPVAKNPIVLNLNLDGRLPEKMIIDKEALEQVCESHVTCALHSRRVVTSVARLVDCTERTLPRCQVRSHGQGQPYYAQSDVGL